MYGSNQQTLCVADFLISWKFLRERGNEAQIGGRWFSSVHVYISTWCGTRFSFSGIAAIGIEFPLANSCAKLARHLCFDRQRYLWHASRSFVANTPTRKRIPHAFYERIRSPFFTSRVDVRVRVRVRVRISWSFPVPILFSMGGSEGLMFIDVN